jgi:hypothetical protein
MRIPNRVFFDTTGKSADPEKGEAILPLSIPRLGRRIDQPADCSSHPRSRPQCCINIEHEIFFLFLCANCASRWNIVVDSYIIFWIRIRGSVILDKGSGSQLMTDPARSVFYLDNVVAIGKIMLSNKDRRYGSKSLERIRNQIRNSQLRIRIQEANYSSYGSAGSTTLSRTK